VLCLCPNETILMLSAQMALNFLLQSITQVLSMLQHTLA